MTIDFKIGENDFLTYQLFHASRSERIKKKRRRGKVILPLIYLAFGFLFFIQDKYVLTFIFWSIGVLWFIIYPIWDRQRYIKHYRDFIKENHKRGFDETVTLELSNDYIAAKDQGRESKILTTELEEINEIPTTIFIRLKGGQSFILPKDKIADINSVTERLKELAGYWNINYSNDEQWAWK